ncbi:glycine zipper 2TM domain-containing protein [Reinekea marina]|uniref:Glycine zipper 2TM domain-containing protein n=2 Tax=Reinekea marina TaxID=1310421 RepID=A0ABV7WW43_9GAMM
MSVKHTLAAIAMSAIAAATFADSDRYDDDYKKAKKLRYNNSHTIYVEGRVISATPIYDTYWYYRSRGDSHRSDRYDEVCRIRDVEVYRESRSTGGNPAAGAIIGGAIGAHVGNSAGHSRDSAVIGAIAGGVIGSVIGSEASRGRETTVHYRVERDCDTRYRQEYRELIGYDVRYRYNGREFTMQTQQHPGRYVQLKVEVQPTAR